MLKLISGRFHPSLEEAFLTRLSELKRDPMAPVLVIAPSSRLVERLQTLLTLRKVPSVNIHFHTLSSLVEEIVFAEETLPKPIFSDPLFFDTLVKNILKEGRSFPEMEGIAIPNGFPPAVRATLRDLLDAGINEDNVEEAIREEFVGKPVDLGSLRSLLNLYRSYLKKIRTLPVLPRSELLIKAEELAPKSNFVKRFHETVFYGFYDMTGLQFNVFEAIAKNHPTSYFFPYVHEDPAYAFSKRFRDTFLQMIPHNETLLDTAQSNGHHRPPLTLMNVSGFQDEAFTIASEILRLHLEEKIPFSDMAVIARNEERLRESLPEVFSDQKIPFRSFAKAPITEAPQVQLAKQLLELTDGDVTLADDIDFQHHADYIGEKDLVRPTDWPENDSWTAFVDRAKNLLKKNFQSASNPSRDVWEMLLDNLEKLEDFALLSATVSRREFLDTLFEKWARIEVEGSKNCVGVSLLYAEAARGLSYPVVFLIGLEEKIFPRLLREDPFLRDDARSALNATLGHKISQKITALEEERLLFQLFLDAASRKLILMRRRSDEEGNVVGASPFLRSLAESRSLDLKTAEMSVQRPLLSKIQKTSPYTLSYSSIVTGFLAGGKHPEALAFVKAAGRDDARLAQGLKARHHLQMFDKPGEYDGLVGERPDDILFKGGKISATALENFGRCAFKYFGENILELRPLEEYEVQESLEAKHKGTAAHHFLEEFYKQLTQDGKKPLPQDFPPVLFEKIFTETIERIPADELNLHPIVWEASKITLKEKLMRYVEADLRFCQETGFQPLLIEKEFVGSLPEFGDKTIWKGRIDRIDKSVEGYSVIDYKTGKYSEKKSPALDAVRGQKLQAPLYILMARELLKKEKGGKTVGFRYVYPMEEDDASHEFSAENWLEMGPAVLKTVQSQLEWARQGHFVMVPEDAQCKWCEIAQICRKSHGLSVYRSRQGEGEKFWKLRTSK